MIFYFSGTGNTRWAAETLTQATGERLLFIPDEMKGECKYELQDGERLGFCFPVHGWQPPHIVRAFISKATFLVKANTFVFALVTCGDSIGRTMELLNKDLGKKGLKASSLYSLIMPESYVCLPLMYTDTPEREHEKISQASKDLEAIGKEITDRKTNIVRTTRGLTPWTFTHVIGAYFNAKMITDKKFSVDWRRQADGRPAPMAARRLVHQLSGVLSPLSQACHQLWQHHPQTRTIFLWARSRLTFGTNFAFCMSEH